RPIRLLASGSAWNSGHYLNTRKLSIEGSEGCDEFAQTEAGHRVLEFLGGPAAAAGRGGAEREGVRRDAAAALGGELRIDCRGRVQGAAVTLALAESKQGMPRA